MFDEEDINHFKPPKQEGNGPLGVFLIAMVASAIFWLTLFL
jgi:hypothetical protein